MGENRKKAMKVALTLITPLTTTTLQCSTACGDKWPQQMRRKINYKQQPTWQHWWRHVSIVNTMVQHSKVTELLCMEENQEATVKAVSTLISP